MARDAARQELRSGAASKSLAVLARLGGDPNIAVDDHPSVQQAQAALDRAKLNLSYTTIAAPADGIVTKVEQLQVGDYLNAATPAFALVSSQNVWIEANFKEVQLTHVEPGQQAEVLIDAYPGHNTGGDCGQREPGHGRRVLVAACRECVGQLGESRAALAGAIGAEDDRGDSVARRLERERRSGHSPSAHAVRSAFRDGH